MKTISKPEFQQKLRTEVDDEADGEGQLEDDALPTNRVQYGICRKEVNWYLKWTKKKNLIAINFGENVRTMI